MTTMVAFLTVRPICPHLLYHTTSWIVQVFLLFTTFVYLFWSNPRHLIPVWRVWQQSQYPFDAWRNMKHIGFAMALQGQRAIHLDSTGQFGRDFWPRRVELGVGIQCDFRDSFSDQTTEKKHRGMVTFRSIWTCVLKVEAEFVHQSSEEQLRTCLTSFSVLSVLGSIPSPWQLNHTFKTAKDELNCSIDSPIGA